MSKIAQNLRFSLRMLLKSPGFTITAVLTLALGIGATTAIYTVVYATLLAPMPYPKPDQLVMVWSTINGDKNGANSAGDFLDWKQRSTVFQDLVSFSGTSLQHGGQARTGDGPGAVRDGGHVPDVGRTVRHGARLSS